MIKFMVHTIDNNATRVPARLIANLSMEIT
jgi:hypothetical protein